MYNIKSLIALLIISLFSACNSGTTTEATSDSYMEMLDSVSNVLDSTSESMEPREAILGYSYFNKMQQNETRFINAFILIKNVYSPLVSTEKVITGLKDLNEDHLPVRKSDTVVMETTNIFLYKVVDINIIDPGDNFIVKNLHPNSRQLIDSLGGNNWEWSVIPKTNANEGRLVMQVIAEDASGKKVPFKTYQIIIEIKLDKTIFRKIWDWMMNNPEKVLVLILIPVVSYLGKKIFERNKSKNKTE